VCPIQPATDRSVYPSLSGKLRSPEADLYPIAVIAVSTAYKNGTTCWGACNRQVAVDAYDSGRGNSVAITTPNTSGCLRPWVTAGYSWRFRVHRQEAGKWWIGRTGAVTMTPGGY
jgi:hypothetical protein